MGPSTSHYVVFVHSERQHSDFIVRISSGCHRLPLAVKCARRICIQKPTSSLPGPNTQIEGPAIDVQQRLLREHSYLEGSLERPNPLLPVNYDMSLVPFLIRDVLHIQFGYWIPVQNRIEEISFLYIRPDGITLKRSMQFELRIDRKSTRLNSSHIPLSR